MLEELKGDADKVKKTKWTTQICPQRVGKPMKKVKNSGAEKDIYQDRPNVRSQIKSQEIKNGRYHIKYLSEHNGMKLEIKKRSKTRKL